ncbi:unnamed protein product [Malus baccata var. baccata]
MASSSTFVFALLVIFSILVLQTVTADPSGNLLPPIFSPILGNLDFSCTKAPAPISDNASKANESSIFNPCFWSYCGGGSCNKTSKFTYSCKCADGAIGLNCANLGISMSNKSTASPPASSGSASSMVQVNPAAFVILMMFAAMIHWK